jgi:hypothetical protein
LAENSLHLGLKKYLQLPGDKIEFPVDSFIIDIVREDVLYEIQTKNFYALKPKLSALLENYIIHVVYPVPLQKYVRRLSNKDDPGKRRKSPKHCSVYHIFDQLVYLANLLAHPNLYIDVVFIEQEDIWINDGKGSWRRKGWSLSDQKLLKVISTREFCCPTDFYNLVPVNTPQNFKNTDLAASAHIPVSLARKMTYTLLRAGLIKQTGKAGNAYLYSMTNSGLALQE